MDLNLNYISPLPQTVIQFLVELSEYNQVERLIVFGSRANNDYESVSDIDLAVDAPLLTKKQWLDIKELAYYDVKTLLQISVVHFNKNPKKLQKHILTTGKLIYVK